MRFKQRIWLLPIMTACVVGIGLAVNARITVDASERLERVEHVQYPLVEALRSIRSEYATIQQTLQQAVVEGDKSALGKAEEHVAAAHQSINRIAALDAGALQLSRGMSADFDAYYGAALSASKLTLTPGSGDSKAAVKSMQQYDEVLSQRLNDSSDAALRDFKQLLAAGAAGVRMTLVISIAAAAAILFILGVGSWILIGSVFRSLGGDPELTTAIVRRVADGDFTQRLELRADDHTSLLRGIATLRDTFGTLVRDVHGSSSTIDAAAVELNTAIARLSERTSGQAASLEQTASNMEQMAATVKQNAENSNQANALAIVAREQAELGGQVVSRAIVAMSEINSSSTRIADVIGVIDDIAFQINLLALNAAVEAARAGEQGLGFAVVAAEVRHLAQRSATAAREIKKLIQDSVTKVKDGSALVDSSGKRLLDIVESVAKVATIVGDISAANQEQSRGLEQINSAVVHLDQMTQENSAMVQQASTVADEVTAQATRLTDLVSGFRVEEDGPLAPSASNRRAHRQARALPPQATADSARLRAAA